MAKDGKSLHRSEPGQSGRARSRKKKITGKMLSRAFFLSCCYPALQFAAEGRSVSTSAAKATVALEIDRLRNLDKATLRRVLRASAETLHLAEGEHHHKIRLSFNETERLMALCGFRIHPTISPRPGVSPAAESRSERKAICARIGAVT